MDEGAGHVHNSERRSGGGREGAREGGREGGWVRETTYLYLIYP